MLSKLNPYKAQEFLRRLAKSYDKICLGGNLDAENQKKLEYWELPKGQKVRQLQKSINSLTNEITLLKTHSDIDQRKLARLEMKLDINNSRLEELYPRGKPE